MGSNSAACRSIIKMYFARNIPKKPCPKPPIPGGIAGNSRQAPVWSPLPPQGRGLAGFSRKPRSLPSSGQNQDSVGLPGPCGPPPRLPPPNEPLEPAGARRALQRADGESSQASRKAPFIRGLGGVKQLPERAKIERNQQVSWSAPPEGFLQRSRGATLRSLLKLSGARRNPPVDPRSANPAFATRLRRVVAGSSTPGSRRRAEKHAPGYECGQHHKGRSRSSSSSARVARRRPVGAAVAASAAANDKYQQQRAGSPRAPAR